MNLLQGKVAAVLGASAEGGTGWAIAEALADAGAKVLVGARSHAPLEVLAERIGGMAQVCDVRSEAQVAALATAALERYGQLDIAVNAAGLPVMGLIDDLDDESLHSALSVNYLGNVYFVRHMARAIGTGGSITLVTSLSTTHPLLPHVAYACAKAGTDCLVRYAAMEYGPRNIKVNSIQPGPILSDMSRTLFEDRNMMRVFEKEIPMGRIGYPKDFADAAVWLSGPAYITGANLPICGGNQLGRFPYMNELPGADAAWVDKGVTLYDRQQSSNGAESGTRPRRVESNGNVT